jgi:hypothetical protein
MGVGVLAAGSMVGCGDDTGGSGGSGGSGTTTSSGGGEGGGSTTTSTTTSSTTTTSTTTSGTGGEGGGGGANPNLPSQQACESACTEGQTGECTSVTGDCASCCTAFLDFAEDACDDEIVAYFDCLESGDPTVCAADCSAAEQALVQCGVTYCISNSTNPLCATLQGCFAN